MADADNTLNPSADNVTEVTYPSFVVNPESGFWDWWRVEAPANHIAAIRQGEWMAIETLDFMQVPEIAGKYRAGGVVALIVSHVTRFKDTQDGVLDGFIRMVAAAAQAYVREHGTDGLRLMLAREIESMERANRRVAQERSKHASRAAKARWANKPRKAKPAANVVPLRTA